MLINLIKTENNRLIIPKELNDNPLLFSKGRTNVSHDELIKLVKSYNVVIREADSNKDITEQTLKRCLLKLDIGYKGLHELIRKY